MLPVLVALAIVGLLLFIIIAGRPDEFIVSRSGKISASPGKIFSHVNELKKWDAWSPWAKLDPDCKITFSGPESGVNSSYAWDGNKKVGAGKMTITESWPGTLVRLQLEFLKPFAATSAVEFRFMLEGEQTLVMWSMAGKNSFFSKVFGLFVDCEKMVGKDYEQGLANLKAVVESAR